MSKFVISTTKSLKSALADLRKQVEDDHGGSLIGNLKNGNFSVRGIKGTYNVQDKNTIEFNIMEKPFLISMVWIQKELQKYFD